MPGYRHAGVDGAGIDSETTLVTLRPEGRDTISVFVNASVSSDFALEVDFGDGDWVEWTTYSATASVTDTVSVAAQKARVRNTTAQTAGDTADANLGAA